LRSLRRFWPVAHLDHFLGRHDYLAELVLEAHALDALLE
jgi:hypothetical protein